MSAADVDGNRLATLVAHVLAGGGREALYPALLQETLLLAQLEPTAHSGPSARLADGVVVPLVEAHALKSLAVPLYASPRALRAGAADRGYWPDGVERSTTLETGAVFPLLRGQAGALLVDGVGEPLPLDAGELAALAEGQSPSEYFAALRALATGGRGKEAAQRLAKRPLYVLGHPAGGLMLFQREVPVFLHLASAERFALRVAAQSGERGQHGLVAGVEILRTAYRGRLQILVEPGPQSFRLRGLELR